MAFRKNKLRDLIAILVGGIPLLISFSLYNKFNSKITTLIFDLICIISVSLFYIFTNNQKYLVEKDAIIFSSSFSVYFQVANFKESMKYSLALNTRLVFCVHCPIGDYPEFIIFGVKKMGHTFQKYLSWQAVQVHFECT